jgi:hypothetical protein
MARGIGRNLNSASTIQRAKVRLNILSGVGEALQIKYTVCTEDSAQKIKPGIHYPKLKFRG